jgi:hypothetical protein
MVHCLGDLVNYIINANIISLKYFKYYVKRKKIRIY